MTRFALTLPDRTVQVLFPLYFLLYIFEGRIAKFVLAMAIQTDCHFCTGKEPFALSEVGRMTGCTSPLLEKRLVWDFCLEHLIGNFLMAINAQIRHRFGKQIGIGCPMGVVAGIALIESHRGVDDRGTGHGFGKIGMALQTFVPGRYFRQVRIVGFMWVMALGAGPHDCRRMHVFLPKFSIVVATETELPLVFSHAQQEPFCCAVRIVACQAVSLLDRRMDILFLSHGIVALITKGGSRGRQFESLPPLLGMFLGSLLVAGKTIPIFHRRVLIFYARYGLMACRGNA